MMDNPTLVKLVTEPEVMLAKWVRRLLSRDGELADEVRAACERLRGCREWPEGRWVGLVERYDPQSRAERAALAAAMYGGSLVYGGFMELLRADLPVPMISQMYPIALRYAEELEGKENLGAGPRYGTGTPVVPF
jgi:hypothetical protein